MPPSFPLLIQNFSMMNGHCEQTNHRYSISVLLRICILPFVPYWQRPSGRCHTVTSRVDSIHWSRPPTTFSIMASTICNGDFQTDPDLFVRILFYQHSIQLHRIRSPAFPFRMYCYIRITKAVYMTGRTFLTRIITKLY